MNLMTLKTPTGVQGQDGMIGSTRMINRTEFVRIISDALYHLGYKRSVACLDEESGIPLHSASISLLMQQVLEGKWDESASTLHTIDSLNIYNMRSALFLISEQKFFQLLENGKTVEAINTLRTELTPLKTETSRVHELCSCIISHYQGEIIHSWNESLKAKPRAEVLDELKKLLLHAGMVPERRLERLIEQAFTLQCSLCTCHNSTECDISLYRNHFCWGGDLPSHTLQILHGHEDEVWHLQFSHDGKYLASASKDQSAIIWDVSKSGEITLKHRLCGHREPVSYVSWSVDDQQLLTCGVGATVRRWDVQSGVSLCIYGRIDAPLTSCAWSSDGASIFTGCSDSSLYMWNLNGTEVERWKRLKKKVLKSSDLEVVTLGGRQTIIRRCTETAIIFVDWETQVSKLLVEVQKIISFSLSKDGKFILVNLFNQEMHLRSMDGDFTLIARYIGHKRARFVIRSCFGGCYQNFIASGSEDSLVYIWYGPTGNIVTRLRGHSGVVNCVSWHPTNNQMIASGSDDHTIRIWQGFDMEEAPVEYESSRFLASVVNHLK